jgi:hypothetical protein
MKKILKGVAVAVVLLGGIVAYTGTVGVDLADPPKGGIVIINPVGK